MGCNKENPRHNWFCCYTANRTKYIIWTSDYYQPALTQNKGYVLFLFASGRQIFLNENRKYSLTLLGMKGVIQLGERKYRETLLILLQSSLVVGKKKESSSFTPFNFSFCCLFHLPSFGLKLNCFSLFAKQQYTFD